MPPVNGRSVPVVLGQCSEYREACQNGARSTVRIVLIVAVCVVSIITAAWAANSSKLGDARERLSAVEKAQESTRDRLGRIENKLDSVLIELRKSE